MPVCFDGEIPARLLRRHPGVTETKILEMLGNKLCRIDQNASGGRMVGLRAKGKSVQATFPRRSRTRLGDQVAFWSRTTAIGLPSKYATVSRHRLKEALHGSA